MHLVWIGQSVLYGSWFLGISYAQYKVRLLPCPFINSIGNSLPIAFPPKKVISVLNDIPRNEDDMLNVKLFLFCFLKEIALAWWFKWRNVK